MYRHATGVHEDLPRLSDVPTISYNDIRFHMNHRMVQTLHLNKKFLRGGSINILFVWQTSTLKGHHKRRSGQIQQRNGHRMQGECVYMIRQDLRSPAIQDLGCENPWLRSRP